LESAIRNQKVDQIVDITEWQIDEETGEIYPEGSKDKSLYVSPDERIYDFIVPKHRYLFKLSYDRYPEQFWIEIIAYKLGILMGLDVPPSFVAVHKKRKITGTLIEWFLNYPGTKKKVKISGADYMQMLIKDYDLEKGKQHNFQSIKKLHLALKNVYAWDYDWRKYWTKTLTFDALIGNTDRHQENWGIIWTYKNKKATPENMTPIFDNGTSMGHEILNKKFEAFDIEKYVSKGTHHMKWDLNYPKRVQHVELIRHFIKDSPEVKDIALNLLKFDTKEMENDIIELTKFKVSHPLSLERVRFIIKLLLFRRENLLSSLGG